MVCVQRAKRKWGNVGRTPNKVYFVCLNCPQVGPGEGTASMFEFGPLFGVFACLRNEEGKGQATTKIGKGSKFN